MSILRALRSIFLASSTAIEAAAPVVNTPVAPTRVDIRRAELARDGRPADELYLPYYRFKVEPVDAKEANARAVWLNQPANWRAVARCDKELGKKPFVAFGATADEAMKNLKDDMEVEINLNYVTSRFSPDYDPQYLA